jgi:hypothetical protein
LLTANTASLQRKTHHNTQHHTSRYADDVDDPSAEPVDALAMGRLMALVAQQGGALDTALEQVCLWACVSCC